MLASAHFSLATLPWIIVGLWAIQLSLVLAGIRHRQVLKATGKISTNSFPRLSVLVAARNEENCIETCVRSINRQDYPNLEIIAINDRSTDRTAEILNRLERELDGRLRVVHINTLPAGWLGKAHAMHVGMQSATGEWICFTDADCEQLSERSLSLAVNEVLERKVDLFTLIPQLILDSVWENLTVPVCSWVMMMWFQPGRVNNPRTRTTYANGSYLLMSRKCYDTVGGWARVRNRICEDAAFAQVAKSLGMKLLVMQSDGLYRLHMYTSIRDSWNGWSRIYYGTLSKTLILISMLRLLVCSILPSLTLFFSVIAGWLSVNRGDFWDMSLVGCLVVVIFQQTQALLTFRLIGSRPAWSLTVVAGNLILLGILGRSLLNHLGLATLHWSGSVFKSTQAIGSLFIPAPPRPRKM